MTSISFNFETVLHLDSGVLDRSFPPNLCSIDGRYSVTNSNLQSPFQPSTLLCACKEIPKLREVMKEGPNVGRFYLSCKSRKCNYFSWAYDVPHCSSALCITWQKFLPSQGWKMISCQNDGSPSKGNDLNQNVCKFDANHILQGGVGDCWFLSAIAVICERQDLIKNVVISRELDENIMLKFNLFLDGFWEVIEVDHFLPCVEDKKKKGIIKLAYSKAKHSQLWVPFLEKAYAKAHGSYYALSGGEISEALVDLTGMPCESIEFHDACFDSEEVWIRLLSFNSCKFPMGCATDQSGEGIVGYHAYSILDVKELNETESSLSIQTNIYDFFQLSSSSSSSSSSLHTSDASRFSLHETKPSHHHLSRHPQQLQQQQEQQQEIQSLKSDSGTLRLLRIRNPWGKTEWRGAMSASSSLWTNKLMEKLDRGFPNDGTFWMTYHDFLRRFVRIDVCKAHLGWFSTSLQDSTRPNHFCCQSSFLLPIFETTWLYVTIHQITKRGNRFQSQYEKSLNKSVTKAHDIHDSKDSAGVSDPNGQQEKRRRIQQPTVRYWYCDLSVLIIDETTQEIIHTLMSAPKRVSDSLELHLPPGLYRICPVHFQPPRQHCQTYVLRVTSSHEVCLQKIPNNPSHSHRLNRSNILQQQQSGQYSDIAFGNNGDGCRIDSECPDKKRTRSQSLEASCKNILHNMTGISRLEGKEIEKGFLDTADGLLESFFEWIKKSAFSDRPSHPGPQRQKNNPLMSSKSISVTYSSPVPLDGCTFPGISKAPIAYEDIQVLLLEQGDLAIIAAINMRICDQTTSPLSLSFSMIFSGYNLLAYDHQNTSKFDKKQSSDISQVIDLSGPEPDLLQDSNFNNLSFERNSERYVVRSLEMCHMSLRLLVVLTISRSSSSSQRYLRIEDLILSEATSMGNSSTRQSFSSTPLMKIFANRPLI